MNELPHVARAVYPNKDKAQREDEENTKGSHDALIDCILSLVVGVNESEEI